MAALAHPLRQCLRWVTSVITLPTPIQNPEADGFLTRLRTKNIDSSKHKETVDSYFSYWDLDRKTLEDTSNGVAKRRGGSANLTNHFYDLVTDFYEYGWGTSFHFAPMYKDSTFVQCIARHEDFLALKLGLAPGMTCVDVGCGVGGPLREIAKFSGAHIVGLNNNEYQVKRCKYLAEKTGMSSLCSAVKGNFEAMPFENNSLDAAFAIEATCHSSALEKPYAEIFRVLKPGGKFAAYEWLTTPEYDETNLVHKKIIHDLEEGNSLPKLYTIPMCLNALKSVGFEIIEYRDLADRKDPLVQQAQEGWHIPLKGSYSLTLDNVSRWKMTPVGRFITDTFVWVLETLGIAPAGTRKVSQVLNLGADALVLAAEENLFTPMFYVLVRKPLDAK
ncbi:Delta(24)-sterol C-methyltransferase [Kappamyces sp. JEL0829]|nr:Delta(24)-sterol C-methyltransferase [Kappamyces sp. JEL0829]